MPIRKYKPTSPGRRFQTAQVFDDVTVDRPHRPLTEPLKRSGGRNSTGELTIWWRGGGHKRLYRIIDFKRDKKNIPGTVSTIEYDPNRSARIALVTYADGEKRYVLQPLGLKVGDTIVAGDAADILPGNALPLGNIPQGTMVHNVELKPGRGGQLARSAGTAIQVVAKEGAYVTIKLRSGEIRMIRALGGDLVGMSTVPEVLAARHMGIRCLAVSCVTNMAAGILPEPIDAEHVLAVGAQAQARLTALLSEVLPAL